MTKIREGGNGWIEVRAGLGSVMHNWPLVGGGGWPGS